MGLLFWGWWDIGIRAGMLPTDGILFIHDSCWCSIYGVVTLVHLRGLLLETEKLGLCHLVLQTGEIHLHPAVQKAIVVCQVLTLFIYIILPFLACTPSLTPFSHSPVVYFHFSMSHTSSHSSLISPFSLSILYLPRTMLGTANGKYNQRRFAR